MIAYLSGPAESLGAEALMIKANGVGYKVFVPSKIGQGLKAGQPLSVYVHTHVREDALDLYGFASLDDLRLFELIINISGIGPKTGLLLLNFGVDEITAAVSKADLDFFTAIPRLGKKNAQKIIIELKPKLGDLEDLNLADESPETNQALQALVGLGFSKKEAMAALRQSPADLDLELRVSTALKYLGQHGR